MVRARLGVFVVCVVALLAGAASPTRADVTTQLPFASSAKPWMAVDPVGRHVFVSGGAGNSSIVVLDLDGNVVGTIPNESGASQMAVDTATNTLYVALHDATAISEIDTQTLTETARFSTAPYADPMDLVIAGGKLWFSCYQDSGTNCGGSPGAIVSANLDGTHMQAAISGWTFATVLAAGGSSDALLAVADTYEEPSAVVVYDVSGTTPRVVSSLPFDKQPAFVKSMAFDPSGENLLLAAGNPYYIESLATSNLLPSGQYPTGPYPDAVAASSDGNWVAGGINSYGGTDVFVYPTGDTTPDQTWTIGDEVTDHGLAFSPDGRRLFALAADSRNASIDLHVLGDTRITSGPSGPTYDATASFSFTSRDSSAAFQCNLDNSGWQACTSPAGYSGLSTGSHTFVVRAVDGSAADAPTASQTWTIQPPDTRLLTGPPNSTYDGSASFTFSSDDSAATFQCKLDDASWSHCASPQSYASLPPGSHTFEVQAVNDGGSPDPVGAGQTWTILQAHTQITDGPPSSTRSTNASFSFSSDESGATFQCRLDGAGWSACTSPTSYSDLGSGSHTFDVRGGNDPTGASRSWDVDLTTPPVATLRLSPDRLLVGDQLTLDASGSHDALDGTIVDYQWDLGGGEFDHDTGSTPTNTTSFATAGRYTVRVMVTNEVGDSAIASATVDVGPAPPPGQVGISINDGDYATNSPNVTLDVVWPAYSVNALISNDGGFGSNGATTTVPVAPQIPWTLPSEGSDRLPRIVYLRFPDSSNPTVTFSDDIVLDTTTPTIQGASRVPGTRGHEVRLRAQDTVSGISQVRFSTVRHGGTTVVLRDSTSRGILKLSGPVAVDTHAAPKWVRVCSAAGTWSRWHRVR